MSISQASDQLINNSISIKTIDCFESNRKRARKSNCVVSINQKKKIISVVDRGF